MTERAPGAALVANGLGALGLTVAALLAGREDALAEQLGWLTLACGALLLALVGDAAVVLHGRRRLALRRVALRCPGEPPAPAAPESVHVLVRAPEQRHFHRDDCLLVRDRSAQQASRQAHEQAGLRPCGACRP